MSKNTNPAPNNYNPDSRPREKSSPAFSMRIKPDIKDQYKGPGPGQYDSKNIDISKKYKFGSEPRGRSKVSNVPGVGQYNFTLVDKIKSPSYSVSKGNRGSDPKECSPGPTAYNPTEVKTEKVGYSLGGSRNQSKPNSNPGPGTYDIKASVKLGPTFKGRYELKNHNVTPGPIYEFNSKIIKSSSPSYS